MKTINIRTSSGWLSEKVENKQKFICDHCGQKLWVAPDGKTIYCDNAECGDKIQNSKK